MEILEKMLQVETEAKQIVENAKLEANEIRKKAREDAKQLVIEGQKNLQNRLREEIAQMAAEAETRRKEILQETETRLADFERTAKERMDYTVDCVMNAILPNV